MIHVRTWLAEAYGAALNAYLVEASEAALEHGYQVGREAMQRGLGPMELTSAHHTALALVLEARSPEAFDAIVARASRFLVESLATYEMVQRGYVEANAALRSMNLQLETQAEALARANAALVRAQQQKDQLSALLVHDLKNPLSGIMLNARYLAREFSHGSNEHKALEHITSASRSLLLMVMNLLDISRSEDGALTPHKAPTALDGLCREIVDAHRIRSELAQLTLDARVEPGLHANIDRDLLRRVLENLLDNALRHTPSGGHVAIEGVGVTRGCVEIRVRDDGNGIPAEERERVFEKYSQLATDRDSAPGHNRGLGLLFCKLAIEAHEGTIRVEANDPKGTVFVMVLPG